MGRKINRQKEYTPIVVTGVSMSIGSLLLMIAALSIEGIPLLSPLSIVYILWLSVVNTAFAFTLWNRAMRTLRALDISIINGTMMPQIVILSIMFLGELPEFLDWIGIFLVGLSAIVVQVLQARRMQEKSASQDIEE
jgi:drug/metabolite transporter (DMT)-like permease